MKSPQSRRPAKYHGLPNLGATCYLNSVLQVLFMTEDFREKVERHTKNNPRTGHIDHELNDLFIKLNKKYAHTDEIIKKLKINNVDEQRDAAEHYEKILRVTSPEASQIFHGELINRCQCKDCGETNESEAGFWHLPLPLVDSNEDYSVVKIWIYFYKRPPPRKKGIEDFFSKSEISGDDQMYCENCDSKCDAVLDCTVKHHPDVLVLLLKRFEFDHRYMKVKIDSAVNVPYTVHIPQNQSYKLYALVEHFGTLRKGHYISKIKSQDDKKWYIFDDLKVRKSEYEHFQLDPTEKSRTAYLLFYRKHTVQDSETTQEDIQERVQNVDNDADVTPVSTDIEDSLVRVTTRGGALAVDTQEVDNAEHLTNKKQRREKRVDMQKTSINRNGEVMIALSQDGSDNRFKENRHSRLKSNDNNNASIQIPEYTEENLNGRSTFQRPNLDEEVAKPKWRTPEPYKDVNNVSVNATYGTELNQLTLDHNSSYYRANEGKKSVCQKARDRPSIEVNAKNRRKNDYENDEGGCYKHPKNSGRSDPGLDDLSLKRNQSLPYYMIEKMDRSNVHQGQNRNRGNEEHVDRKYLQQSNFGVSERDRGRRSREPQTKSSPKYGSQDDQLEKLRPNNCHMRNEGRTKEMYNHNSQQLVSNQSHEVIVEKVLWRHNNKSRERHQVSTQAIHHIHQYTERPQQKGPGSAHRERAGQSQRKRMHYDTDRQTSEGTTEIHKPTPKDSRDQTEQNSKSHNQSRGDHSRSSFTTSSPNNRRQNPDESIETVHEGVKNLKLTEKSNGEQKKAKKQDSRQPRKSCSGQRISVIEMPDNFNEEVNSPKKRKFDWGCVSCFPRKKRTKD